MKNDSTSHDEWVDQMSAYLDGDLDADRHAELEAHLGSCGGCRRVLEDLRDVVRRAGDLDAIEPPRDLWAGIAATIDAPSPRPEAKVIALPTAPAEAERVGRRRSRISVSVPQLAAASVALVALSSMGTLALGAGHETGSADGVEVATSPLAFVASSQGAPPELAAELAQLEQMLDGTWSGLDANTARVLERNLAVIEQAIQDSMDALALDPGNDFLTEHLERVYERKLTFLRDVTQMAEWAD